MVDLVIQVASPLSVSSCLQRVGRAEYHVGGRSHDILYPPIRQELIGLGSDYRGYGGRAR
ncbi:hypothetical protein CRD60_03345 [Bifidobacterium aemilianum]|uniref:Uncharacterized protein n=1 Tax=Bifidobacterium aemilianum TaxID=2493120 RepID=A0A366KAK7_9BIFI|nr:hypothetical protein [Bifidobacterium aemilianum]RBP98188.1 hypothetical protein CRD60_03345 [Bifidobacterium aemilianum]